MAMTATHPMTAATGSTVADSWPYHQAFARDMPSRRSGTATAVPPVSTACAAASVGALSATVTRARATPQGRIAFGTIHA